MSEATQRPVRDAERLGVSNATRRSRALDLQRDSVLWIASTSLVRALSRRNLLPTEGASRARTRERAASMDRQKTENGEWPYSHETDLPVSCADRVAGSMLTTSSHFQRTRICGMTYQTDERCAFHATAKRPRLDGVDTGSRFEASEIAAKRLAQEVLPFA